VPSNPGQFCLRNRSSPSAKLDPGRVLEYHVVEEDGIALDRAGSEVPRAPYSDVGRMLGQGPSVHGPPTRQTATVPRGVSE